MPGRALRLFYSYSHKDEALRDVLETHLAMMRRKGVIEGWHDRRITPGAEWRDQLDLNLEQADIILLLVSADFLASDYCYQIEMNRALERHQLGEARVIPILLRPVDWREAPFAHLQSLPRDLQAVTRWSNQDEAWTDVARGIRAVVESMQRDLARPSDVQARTWLGTAFSPGWLPSPGQSQAQASEGTSRPSPAPSPGAADSRRSNARPRPSGASDPTHAGSRAGEPGSQQADARLPFVGAPDPNYADARARSVGEQLHAAQETLDALLMAGAATEELRQARARLLELRRELRDGGRLHAGDILSERFQLIDRLGIGGFATVWKAFDRRTRQLVAVKALHGQFGHDRTRIERFFRGARTMAELHHQHVVRVIEPQVDDAGHPYFVMEYLAGGDFHQAVVAGRLSQTQVLRAILEVGEALEFGHSRGCIHRDVKPHNILLGADGSSRLTDFDLVRVPDSTGGTRSGALGTFIYAAPEEMESARDVDARADVFSLGMTALFGFHGATLPPLAFRNPERFIQALDCPVAAREALEHAVVWEVAERTSSVAAFCAELEAGMGPAQ